MRMVGRVLKAEDAEATDRLLRWIDWPGALAFVSLLAEGCSAERAELAGWSEPEGREAAEEEEGEEEEGGDGGVEEGGPTPDA